MLSRDIFTPSNNKKTRSEQLRVSLCSGSGVGRLYHILWYGRASDVDGCIIARKMSRTNLLPGYLGALRVAVERLHASGQLPGC